MFSYCVNKPNFKSEYNKNNIPEIIFTIFFVIFTPMYKANTPKTIYKILLSINTFKSSIISFTSLKISL